MSSSDFNIISVPKRKGTAKRNILFKTILAWNKDAILRGNRSDLNLPPMLPLPSHFTSSFEYYNSMYEVVIEETRSTIYNGLKSESEGLLALHLADFFAYQNFGDLYSVPFIYKRGDQTLMKPGSLYELSCYFPRSNDQNVEKTCLAAISLSKNRATYGCIIIELWIHKMSEIGLMLRDIIESKNGEVDRGVEWRADYITNIISYHRMAMACANQPDVQCMPQLLGMNLSSSHIKFTDDDDAGSNATVENCHSANVDLVAESEPLPTWMGPLTATVVTNSNNLKLCDIVSSLNQRQLDSLEYCLLPLERKILSSASASVAPTAAPGGGVSTSRSPLMIIHGPPGCGKTHLTASLLYLLVQANQYVVVSAATNKATAVVAEKFLSLMQECIHDDGSILQPRCVLVGVEESVAAASSQSDEMGIKSFQMNRKGSAQVNSQGSDQGKSKSSVQVTSQGSVDADCHYLSQLVQNFEFPTTSSDIYLYSCCDRIHAMLSIVKFIVDGMQADVCLLIGFEYLTFVRRNFGKIMSFIKEKAPKSFNLNFETTMQDIVARLSVIEERLELDAVAVQQMTKDDLATESNHKKMRRKLRNTAKTCKIELGEISKRLTWLEQWLEERGLVENFENEYLTGANIVFCTLSTIGSATVRQSMKFTVDYVVVDEAAQVLEPELCIALSLCPTNVVLIGDPQQLPALALSSEVQSSGRGMSTMHRLMKCTTGNKMHSQPTSHTTGVMLNVQYRMHPDILAYPNIMCYQNQLLTAPSILEREHCFKNISMTTIQTPWDRNYFFLDVNGTDSTNYSMLRFFSTPCRGSVYNCSEVLVIARLLRRLIVDFGIAGNRICVITFYSAQVRAIRKYIGDDNRLRQESIRVNSVDSFQGSESDIVLISFVRSNPKGNTGFVKDYRRLNVALTRAKHMLICVGNVSCLGGDTANIASKHESVDDDDGAHLRGLIDDAKKRDLVFAENII